MRSAHLNNNEQNFGLYQNIQFIIYKSACFSERLGENWPVYLVLGKNFIHFILEWGV